MVVLVRLTCWRLCSKFWPQSASIDDRNCSSALLGAGGCLQKLCQTRKPPDVSRDPCLSEAPNYPQSAHQSVTDPHCGPQGSTGHYGSLIRGVESQAASSCPHLSEQHALCRALLPPRLSILWLCAVAASCWSHSPQMGSIHNGGLLP